MPENERTTDSTRDNRQGMVLLFTGPGKGKTTAALGTLFRAWGWGWRICVIQFIKSENGRWGEVRAAEKLGIEWHSLGTGFVRQADEAPEAAERALRTWELAQAKIASGEYDLIILDEITYIFSLGWLDPNQFVDWIRRNRPPSTHVIMTGRYAPPELLELADLVTEAGKVKHPFDLGVEGQRGIEF